MPDIITDENRSTYQAEIQKAGEDYLEAKDKYKMLMTDFQEMKLYETFGESAPQAALQIGIVLQTGSLNATQMFSIFTSLLSLTLGASEIMLMMKTKDNEFKEASWKQTWILVFPAMFFVVVPRILCISLLIAYTKEYLFIFLIIFILLSMAINYEHLRRDPGHVILGILTNVFAPCIVIQEGSSFFKRSGYTSSLLHCLGLVCLFLAVVGGGVNLCPDTSINRHAPILHCFENDFLNQNAIQRCSFNELFPLNCTQTIEKSPINSFIDCTSTLISVDFNWPWSSDKPTIKSVNFVTLCGTGLHWLPLLIACSVLVVLLIISTLLVSCFLSKLLDRSSILKWSRTCIPLRCLDPIWDEDQMLMQEPILDFLNNPSLKQLETVNRCLTGKTGQNLIDLSIQNDFYEVMNHLLPILKSDDMRIELAIKRGSPQMIKMILDEMKYYRQADYRSKRVKIRENEMTYFKIHFMKPFRIFLKQSRIKAWDERLNRTALMNEWKTLKGDQSDVADKTFDKPDPVLKLQQSCNLSLEDIISHCEILKMTDPFISIIGNQI